MKWRQTFISSSPFECCNAPIVELRYDMIRLTILTCAWSQSWGWKRVYGGKDLWKR